ncbi:MAG: DUF3592 domain-containing protein [Bacteroidota bacterium]
MNNRFFKKDNEGKIILGLLFLIAFGILGRQYFREKNIFENQAKTEGTITKFKKSGKDGSGVTYKYKVNNIWYYGSVGVHPFKCENGKKGCVGKKFTVYYSTENPKYSRINLGIYEKHKATVEFFE